MNCSSKAASHLSLCYIQSHVVPKRILSSQKQKQVIANYETQSLAEKTGVLASSYMRAKKRFGFPENDVLAKITGLLSNPNLPHQLSRKSHEGGPVKNHSGNRRSLPNIDSMGRLKEAPVIRTRLMSQSSMALVSKQLGLPSYFSLNRREL